MTFLIDAFFVDSTNLFMGIASCVLFLFAMGLFGVVVYRYCKNPALFSKVDSFVEYRLTEVLNVFLAFATIFGLLIIKTVYFLRLDEVLNSLWVLLCLILFNVAFKILSVILNVKEKYVFLQNIFLRCIDNFVVIILITVNSAIIASQIPIVDISKYLGVDVLRVDLINAPFLIESVFIVLSVFLILLERVMLAFGIKFKAGLNYGLKVFVPFLSAGLITLLYPLNFRLCIGILIGILSGYIVETVSTYLNNRKHSRQKDSAVLNFLVVVSNISFSSFVSMLLIVLLVFTCLNYAGVYGVSVALLGLISALVFTSNVNIFEHNSESYKCVANTVNNVSLFYIFFETLEYIYRTQIHINLFSNNVIVGLFAGGVLVIFNILKFINLVKYVNVKARKVYLTVRTFFYIVFFVCCMYFLLPIINYELLASLVLGLVLLTSVVSVVFMNAIDVLEGKKTKTFVVMPLIRNVVIPLMNQITTALILIIILLLPMIK